MVYRKHLSYKLFIVYSLALFNSTPNYAADQLNTPPQASTPFVAAFSVGPAWASGGEKQTFYVSPFIEKTYTADQETDVIADGELFLGFQHALTASLQGQFGLAIAATSSTDLSGNIWDDADSNFNNFTYEYKIQHTHVAAKGKLLVDINQSYTPYVSVSLGAGFNKAYGFGITPLVFAAIPAPHFSSNTIPAFTYTIGVGIQRAISTHWQAGMGYEFADWGKSQLNNATGQAQGNGISLNHLYTNSLQFNISYNG